ncbi:ADP-ribosylation factor-like protein 5A [Nowakowskiella sp. JEL0407]|nr:ADP-ribosylation factor-like protein 5A [Nowakowskiella sp. JEL0407]
MGIVFSQLYAIYNRLMNIEQEVKIVIVGLDNAGKTTILYRLKLHETISTGPTIGSNVEHLVLNHVKCVVWDIGGQEYLRASWSTYYIGANAVILVIDSSDEDRLHISNDELSRMMEHEQLRKASLLVYANKQDIKGSMSAVSISEALGLQDLKDRQWHIQVFHTKV